MDIFPSLIASDVLNLQRTVEMLEPLCAGFHVDVMDWHYVPNLTMGPLFVNALARVSTKPLLVHLMIENVHSFLNRLQLRPKDIVSFHIDQQPEICRIIEQLRAYKWRVSVAIRPETPLQKLYAIIHLVDHVLLMSVDPGFSGQSFQSDSLQRLEEIVAYRNTHSLSYKICVDGGINIKNICQLAQRGADEVTIGSGIFEQPDPIRALQSLYDKVA